MQTYIYESTSLCINITVYKNYNIKENDTGPEAKLHQWKRHLATRHLLHHGSVALTSLEPLLALTLCFYTIEI